MAGFSGMDNIGNSLIPEDICELLGIEEKCKVTAYAVPGDGNCLFYALSYLLKGKSFFFNSTLFT